jgi:hypothetical protein
MDNERALDVLLSHPSPLQLKCIIACTHVAVTSSGGTVINTEQYRHTQPSSARAMQACSTFPGGMAQLFWPCGLLRLACGMSFSNPMPSPSAWQSVLYPRSDYPRPPRLTSHILTTTNTCTCHLSHHSHVSDLCHTCTCHLSHLSHLHLPHVSHSPLTYSNRAS